MITIKRFDLQCGDGNGLYETPSPEGEYVLAADVEALLVEIGNRPDITIQHCTFEGLNLDGTQPFEFEPVGAKEMRCKSINMLGWMCIGPSGDNPIQRANKEIDLLKSILMDIKHSGEIDHSAIDGVLKPKAVINYVTGVPGAAYCTSPNEDKPNG